MLNYACDNMKQAIDFYEKIRRMQGSELCIFESDLFKSLQCTTESYKFCLEVGKNSVFFGEVQNALFLELLVVRTVLAEKHQVPQTETILDLIDSTLELKEKFKKEE